MVEEGRQIMLGGREYHKGLVLVLSRSVEGQRHECRCDALCRCACWGLIIAAFNLSRQRHLPEPRFPSLFQFHRGGFT
jgi:hypothetical protein